MSAASLFTDGLLKHGPNGQTVTVTDCATELKDKVIGIYFSAHWCPPCRQFTPMLVQTYKDIVGADKNFEIVFVSSDQDQKAFEGYWKDHPWLTVPFDSQTRQTLAEKFGVRGIPMFVIVGADGKVITTKGREHVSQHKAAAFDQWAQ